jgi:hypothetical protein
VEGIGQHERGIIPSQATIQYSAYELYFLPQKTIPIQKKKSELGVCSQLDYKKSDCFILKSFCLHDITQREVELFALHVMVLNYWMALDISQLESRLWIIEPFLELDYH